MTTNNNNAISQIGDETARSLAPGQLLMGRYRLERVLGQGGMGVVWLARDETLDHPVALKFLPSFVVKDRASLTELKNETKRTLVLTHPNIVRTYGFLEDETIAGISMEYVDSDTLRNRRLDQPSGIFQPSELGEWMKQLCAALDYAHLEASIVHRDLKPANLMINKDKNGDLKLKVADFGIARSLVEVTEMTGNRNVAGTLVYMGPQQLVGEAVSSLDDIYAVGATIYELCTTRPPFYTGDIAGQVYSKVAPSMTERRKSLGLPIGDIPDSWERTIAACLAKDPAQRPQTASEIAAGLGLIPSLPPRLDRPLPTEPTPPRITVPGGTWVNPLSSQGTVANKPGIVSPSRRKMTPAVMSGAGAGILLLACAIWYFAHPRSTSATGTNQSSLQQAQAEAQRKAEDEKRLALEKEKAEADRLANARGLLMVKGPAGARAKFGDGPAQSLPAVFTGVKLGKHSVEITREGFDPIMVPAEVSQHNEQVDVLVPPMVRSTGALKVETVPADLKLKLVLKDKQNSLNTKTLDTPLITPAIETGEYEVTVMRDGWPAQVKTAMITKGAEQKLVFEYAGGIAMIASTTPGAKVLINGVDKGPAPVTLTDLAPGQLQYSISASGYETKTGTLVVAPGETAPADVTLRKVATKSSSSSTKSSNTRTNSNSGREPEYRRSEYPSSGRRLKDGLIDGFTRNLFR